jgi:DNA-binding transcriptional LysR family regulator
MEQPEPNPGGLSRLDAEASSGADLRKLRYFVTVADEANFGRAAARLYMTQPALSRQIRSLEAEIGVRLFDRDRQGVRLTLAGEQFCDDAKRLLELFVAARRRARQAARTARHFTVGFMPGVAATPVIRQFAESLPGADISVVHTSPSDQVDYLLSGTVDVCFVQLPISPRLFEVVPLFQEPQVIALPAEHPFATKEGLSLEHFSSLGRVGLDELTPDPRSSGRGSGWSVPIEEQLERVALGLGYAILPDGAARFYHRRDIRYLHIAGLDEVQVALAQDKARRMPEFGRFARIARHLLGGIAKAAPCSVCPHPCHHSRATT